MLKIIAKTAKGGIFEFSTMHDLQRQIEIWEYEQIQFDLSFVREPTSTDIEHTLIMVSTDLHNILLNQEVLSKDQIIEEIKSSVNAIRALRSSPVR